MELKVKLESKARLVFKEMSDHKESKAKQGLRVKLESKVLLVFKGVKARKGFKAKLESKVFKAHSAFKGV